MQEGHLQFSPAVVGGTLSNQRLEAGREGQQVVGRPAACCGPSPSEPGRLGYPPPGLFVDRRIESGPCPSVTRITIHVASVTSFLGLGEVANRLGAHSGYGRDDRLGVLPARGAGEPNVVPIAAERSRWRETDGSLMQ
jgi:hypothetical protein